MSDCNAAGFNTPCIMHTRAETDPRSTLSRWPMRRLCNIALTKASTRETNGSPRGLSTKRRDGRRHSSQFRIVICHEVEDGLIQLYIQRGRTKYANLQAAFGIIRSYPGTESSEPESRLRGFAYVLCLLTCSEMHMGSLKRCAMIRNSHCPIALSRLNNQRLISHQPTKLVPVGLKSQLSGRTKLWPIHYPKRCGACLRTRPPWNARISSNDHEGCHSIYPL